MPSTSRSFGMERGSSVLSQGIFSVSFPIIIVLFSPYLAFCLINSPTRSAGKFMRLLLLAQKKPWIAIASLFPTRLHQPPHSYLVRQPPPVVNAGDGEMMLAGLHELRNVAQMFLVGNLHSLFHFSFRKYSKVEAGTRDSSGQSAPQMQ
ncbi:MAG: hypothetical protein BWY89_01435 [Bacteroidetes bacterium ADurb.BinA012]|nr:MAG: hypothetical protein BWY89_01435 [Bacteroidetes bacterium ADurb.BinA012]